jgi:hypothetical protein
LTEADQSPESELIVAHSKSTDGFGTGCQPISALVQHRATTGGRQHLSLLSMQSAEIGTDSHIEMPRLSGQLWTVLWPSDQRRITVLRGESPGKIFERDTDRNISRLNLAVCSKAPASDEGLGEKPSTIVHRPWEKDETFSMPGPQSAVYRKIDLRHPKNNTILRLWLLLIAEHTKVPAVLCY